MCNYDVAFGQNLTAICTSEITINLTLFRAVAIILYQLAFYTRTIQLLKADNVEVGDKEVHKGRPFIITITIHNLATKLGYVLH